jgi:4-hydroxy-3-methylbut-2-en-1-yl diphosphate reductase
MQTTQIKANVKAVIGGLMDLAKEILVINTICNVTENKQKVTKELAGEVDLMLVVGGKNSANTTHLAEISREINPATYHIEKASELKPEWLKPGMKIGISAGASTPDYDIKEVKEFNERLQVPEY